MEINSCVRGLHVSKHFWTPTIGETFIELLHVTSLIMWQPEVVYNWQPRTMVLAWLKAVPCGPGVIWTCPLWNSKDHHYSKGKNKSLGWKAKKRLCSSISKRDNSYPKYFSSRRGEYVLDITCLECLLRLFSILTWSTWIPFSPAENTIACTSIWLYKYIAVPIKSKVASYNERAFSTSSSLE